MLRTEHSKSARDTLATRDSIKAMRNNQKLTISACVPLAKRWSTATLLVNMQRIICWACNNGLFSKFWWWSPAKCRSQLDCGLTFDRMKATLRSEYPEVELVWFKMGLAQHQSGSRITYVSICRLCGKRSGLKPPLGSNWCLWCLELVLSPPRTHNELSATLSPVLSVCLPVRTSHPQNKKRP